MIRSIWVSLVLALVAAPVVGQSTQVAFGAAPQDTGLPVELTADALRVNQTDGTAVFDGNVAISQGEMQLMAGAVLVIYRASADGIARLEASKGITLRSGPDQATAETAIYDIDSGQIDLSGSVVFSQGPVTISAQAMTIRLTDGTAELSGGVKTTLSGGQD